MGLLFSRRRSVGMISKYKILYFNTSAHPVCNIHVFDFVLLLKRLITYLNGAPISWAYLLAGMSSILIHSGAFVMEL